MQSLKVHYYLNLKIPYDTRLLKYDETIMIRIVIRNKPLSSNHNLYTIKLPPIIVIIKLSY